VYIFFSRYLDSQIANTAVIIVTAIIANILVGNLIRVIVKYTKIIEKEKYPKETDDSDNKQYIKESSKSLGGNNERTHSRTFRIRLFPDGDNRGDKVKINHITTPEGNNLQEE
jgi:hypothetical protein